jgi:ferrous iron transport protein B
LRKIGIVGSPNVGKSVIFNRLTGSYVTVSNYPGTTVNVTRGKAKIEGEELEVVDTPGMYSLLPITDDLPVYRGRPARYPGPEHDGRSGSGGDGD